ncbi:MAG: peptidase M14 [Tannerella sp.]|nr:peptidase M14 [Tannerella sp.]
MTKRAIILSLSNLLLFLQSTFTQPIATYYNDKNYFYCLKDNYAFDPGIPQPKDVLGFDIGQQHVDWSNVLMYMKALDDASPRVSIKQFGRTNQFRQFIQVTFTSEKNQQNLENIRQQHLKLTDPEVSKDLDIDKMPVITNLMYSIHGNEPSGVNSSLLMAYYLAALQGEEIERLLDNMVIVITPGLNPDGINRFASWVNSSRSFPDVADLNSREFSETWPSSRTNHYWADCNRDWLMAQQKEGQNALEMYFEWIPNVVCDFHEQGGDRTYYFSPGDPKRTHPLTPQENQELTAKLTSFSARELDKIGTLYYSKERYDDFYYGKGAAYGDIHGSVSILYEQLAARGHLRPTRNFGLMSFPSTIRNQVFSAIGVLNGALAMKNELLAYLRDYYVNTSKQAKTDPVQGYVFNTRGSKGINFHFLENLHRHRIEVYHLSKNQIINGTEYLSEDSYVIPVNQKYYGMVRTLMENVTEFKDSVFYDISTWTFPHAYNLQYDELKSTAGLLGEKVNNNVFPKGNMIGGKSEIAYLFDNSQYYSHRLVAELLRNGLIVKVSSKPFHYRTDGKEIAFGYGAFAVPTQNQPLDKEKLYKLIDSIAVVCGIDVYSAKQGLMIDFDLGTPYFTPLELPRVAVITGSGMGIPESGEVWMLLSERFDLKPVIIDYSKLTTANLDKYNVIVMADGSPVRSLSETVVNRIKSWVANGGTLIATGQAYQWTNKTKLTDIKTIPTIKAKRANEYKDYATRSEDSYGTSVEGVILNCRLDRTHPLGWGYNQEYIAVMKVGATAFEKSDNRYASPLFYAEKPYLSGCISKENLKRFASNPAVIIQTHGSGRNICFADDINFRMYWYGASKIFLNAVFFGQLL